jgi:hypothetical protein
MTAMGASTPNTPGVVGVKEREVGSCGKYSKGNISRAGEVGVRMTTRFQVSTKTNGEKI